MDSTDRAKGGRSRDRGEPMMTKESAQQLAEAWVAAWNAHDLEGIMAHYEEDVELVSPVALQLLGAPDGKITGKSNLRAYFKRGLEAFPTLRFTLVEVLSGVHSVVLYYVNHRGTHTAEYLEISAQGRISRVVANYSD